MAQALLQIPTQNNQQYTLDVQYTSGGTTLTLNQSVAGIVQAPGVCVVDRIDSGGNKTATKRTYYKFTGVSSAQLTGITTVDGTDQTHAVGAIVEFVPDVKTFQSHYDALAQLVAVSTGLLDTTKVVDLTTAQTLTNKVIAGGSNTISGITEAMLSTSDLTTLDVSTSKHGFTPKAPNDSTKFLRGDATWAAPTAASTDGWTLDANTLVYVSASSVKVTGSDVTAQYTKGTKIKFTQTTVKYFVVTSSSFSTDTTINLTGGTDYTVANAAITSNYYSYQSSPQGYPDYFAYLATYGAGGSMTIGSVSTLLSRFSVKGRTCFWELSITGTLGGTTSNIVTLTVPVAQLTAAADNYTTMGEMRDGGGSWFVGKMQSQPSAGFYILKSDNSNIATGASFIFSGIAIYEI